MSDPIESAEDFVRLVFADDGIPEYEIEHSNLGRNLVDGIRSRDAAVRREARRMPNGWPAPTFMSTEDDGSLSIEWCFGEQGKPGSWRVSLFWDPCDGLLGVVTRFEGQMSAEGDDGVRLVANALATGGSDVR